MLTTLEVDEEEDDEDADEDEDEDIGNPNAESSCAVRLVDEVTDCCWNNGPGTRGDDGTLFLGAIFEELMLYKVKIKVIL